MDEAAGIHELLTRPLRAYFRFEGVFFYAWLVVAIPIVLVTGIFYLRFLLHFNGKLRNLLILSAGVYLGGVIGMEMVGGGFSQIYGENNLVYTFIAQTEEILELLGVSLFIYTLLRYVEVDNPTFTVRVAESAQSD